VILAIDPGPIETAWVRIEKDTYKIIDFGIEKNDQLLSMLNYANDYHVVIEMIASYGMSVGIETFETCVWIGRYLQKATQNSNKVYRLTRKDVKINLCGSMKAKDGNIIQALVDRFSPYTPNKGKGNKKNPGWFYGFHDDIWQAYAVGITYLDMQKTVPYSK
jgi:hypothetical protein